MPATVHSGQSTVDCPQWKDHDLMIKKSRLPWIMDVLAVIIIAAGAVGIYRATPYPSPPATPPACATEDGGPYPCVWDGPTRGTPGAPGYRQGQRVTITERP